MVKLFKKPYRASSLVDKQKELGYVFELVARELGVSIDNINKMINPVEVGKEVAA